MKITSLQPLILSPKADEVLDIFKDLGFEPRHEIENILNKDITTTCLKDANGFHIDVASVASMPQDKTIIRMNVDDFDAAYDFLISKGFVHNGGKENIVVSETSKSTMMTSPTGFAFDLCQHIKK